MSKPDTGVEVVNLPIDKLLESDDNPQTMSPQEFNRLVASIQEDGFDEPLIVAPNGDGTYQIISGHHRYKACRIIGYTEIPCIVKDLTTDDQRRIKMIKANVIRGDLDPKKFTKIVDKLMETHSREELEYLLGFSDRREFDRLYKEIRSGLPPEIQKKLDATKKEIRTIDDLAKVLNQLFSEYGDTLDLSFMIFVYQGQDQFYVQMDSKLKKLTDEIAEYCTTNKLDINVVLGELLKQSDISQLNSEPKNPVQKTSDSRKKGEIRQKG